MMERCEYTSRNVRVCADNRSTMKWQCEEIFRVPATLVVSDHVVDTLKKCLGDVKVDGEVNLVLHL